MAKGNQSLRNDEEAVSPVIATILMVAITVVLAATVYFWLTGFGQNQPQAVSASFTAAAIDLPSGVATGTSDPDSVDDALVVTFVQAVDSVNVCDVSIAVDGEILAPDATCPGTTTGYTSTGWDLDESALADGTWNPGDLIYLSNAAGAVGTHNVVISVHGAVVLNAAPQIHDDNST